MVYMYSQVNQHHAKLLTNILPSSKSAQKHVHIYISIHTKDVHKIRAAQSMSPRVDCFRCCGAYAWGATDRLTRTTHTLVATAPMIYEIYDTRTNTAQPQTSRHGEPPLRGQRKSKAIDNTPKGAMSLQTLYRPNSLFIAVPAPTYLHGVVVATTATTTAVAGAGLARRRGRNPRRKRVPVPLQLRVQRFIGWVPTPTVVCSSTPLVNQIEIYMRKR